MDTYTAHWHSLSMHGTSQLEPDGLNCHATSGHYHNVYYRTSVPCGMTVNRLTFCHGRGHIRRVYAIYNPPNISQRLEPDAAAWRFPMPTSRYNLAAGVLPFLLCGGQHAPDEISG